MSPGVHVRTPEPAASSANASAVQPPPENGIAATRWLVRSLRTFGGLDLLAAGAVLMPYDAMNAIHALCGLGELPRAPVVGYLARSTSVLYALHGAMILFVSADVERYWRLVRFLAIAAIAHGAILAGIDAWEGLPLWWKVLEGTCIAATGAVVLALQRRAERSGATGTASPAESSS